MHSMKGLRLSARDGHVSYPATKAVKIEIIPKTELY